MSDLDTALKALAARRPRQDEYRRYYDGDQPLAFATDKFTNAFGSTFEKFAYNLCGAVVDAAADRMRLTGFGTSALGEEAWEIWKRNRMVQRSGEVHTEAFTTGDAYVIVWPDATGAVPVITVNTAETTTVFYDHEQPGRVAWAAKSWTQADKRTRLNLYYPDHLERYITQPRNTGQAPTGKAFQEWRGVDGRDPWPVPNPYGVVPVFHFPNNSRMGRDGTSELKPVLRLQDALNKAICDMLVAMEFVALPQRWATGIEVKYDKVTGKPIPPFTPGVDRIWFTGAAPSDVAFGQFESGDVRQFLDVISGFEYKIARVSRTSLIFLQIFSGTPPSGESLKTSEGPFLAKIADRMEAFGNVWQDVMLLAMQIAHRNTRPDPGEIVPDWQDPAPKSQKEAAETAEIKGRVGVPLRVLLSELGYSDIEVENMLTQAASDTAATSEAAIQRAQAAILAGANSGGF